MKEDTSIADNDINLVKKLKESSNKIETFPGSFMVNPVVANEMARKCDLKALEFIFPDCRNRPYCLRSYDSLRLFLFNPASDEFTGATAPNTWLQLSESFKEGVFRRKKLFDDYFPYLRVSIEDLKSCLVKFEHRGRSVEEFLADESADSELSEALIESIRFLDCDLRSLS